MTFQLVLTQPTLSTAGTVDHEALLRRQLSDLRLAPQDIVLLPEHWDLRHEREPHVRAVTDLARLTGGHVVGGTQHEQRGTHAVNSGVAIGPDGTLAGTFEKQRPYAREITRVDPGTASGELVIGACNVAVMVCADFWFFDLFARLERLPDLVLVPALSVTRKSTPDYSRSLWRHLAIARAYELGVYVGISDWSADSELGALRTAGVAGFADPTGTDPERFFTPVAGSHQAFEVDLEALQAFREDRRARGFFWRS
jgi:predicted amidohydrolase